MSLPDATRALEIVDARLTAIQATLAREDCSGDPLGIREGLLEIIDLLDLVIGDVRLAAGEIVEHECRDPRYGELLQTNRELAAALRIK